MSNSNSTLTQSRLKEFLHYDPISGEFYWVRSKGGAAAGNKAGCRCGGYIIISIDHRDHKAHRLAWLFSYGELPRGHIDHINMVRDDNRISNLRCVTHTENMHNKRDLYSKNTTGFPGVSWCNSHQQFIAQISFNKVKYHLGYFDNPNEAHIVYAAKKKSLYFPT